MSATVIHDQSNWGRLQVTGRDRVRFLQAMLTNDIVALAEGGWCRAALLNPKGRVLAVADVVNRGELGFLLLTEPVTAAKLRQGLERHAIADDVGFVAADVPVHRVWDSPAAVCAAPPVFALRAGSPAPEVEVRRIEGGLPRYGVDVSEDHFPFEANLDTALCFTKGCYVGQEVIARATSRGYANRRLVGLRLGGRTAVAAGTPVVTAEGAPAGVVTSSAVSPDLGPIALAYIGRAVWDPDSTVSVGDRLATVSALPFA